MAVSECLRSQSPMPVASAGRPRGRGRAATLCAMARRESCVRAVCRPPERLGRGDSVSRGKIKKADSTRRCSQAVPHPNTNRALCCLTSEVRRDPVYSTRYGRQRKVSVYCTVRCGVHSDINLSSVLNHGGVHRRCWLLPWTDKHKLLCSLALGNNPWKYCQLVFQSSVT